MERRKIDLSTMKMLCTSDELIKMTKEIHYNEMDFIDGNIRERIQTHEQYLLDWVHLSDIEDVIYYIDDELVDEYCIMNRDEMPPVILDIKIDGRRLIIDGSHRITVCRNDGDTYILAYIPIVY